MFASGKSLALPKDPPARWSSRSKRRITFVTYALALGAAILVYTLTQSALALGAVLAVIVVVVARRVGAKNATGIFLLLMSVQWLAIALLRFNGFEQYEAVSALKEVILVVATGYFFYRTKRFQLTSADLLLAGALLLIFFEQIFYTDFKGLRDDWEWALPYLLGRVLTITPRTQEIWAKCAVWFCALLAIIGAWEIEVLGSFPRVLLLGITEGDTKLPAPFLANGYSGFRAASTMVSPLAFSALCMVALLLWWTYMKNPIPAALIGAGLALTLTRSAVFATFLGALIIGIRRREKGRIALFSAIALLGLIIAVPTLNLEQYLNITFTSGADTSTEGHQASIVEGFNRMLEYPLGTGAGTVGPRVVAANPDALDVESSYLTIAVEYGIAVGALYVGFLIACLWSLFKLHERIGYAGFAILLSFGILLAIGPLHLDIPLACWVWVPIGMGVARAAESSSTNSLAIGWA
jgi:hypothetical protein